MNELDTINDLMSALDEGYQMLLDEVNDGQPSYALRYVYIKNALKAVEDSPHSNDLVQNTVASLIRLELQRLEAVLSITKVTVPKN